MAAWIKWTSFVDRTSKSFIYVQIRRKTSREWNADGKSIDFIPTRLNDFIAVSLRAS